MDWESKKALNRSEEMLMKLTLPLGYLTYKRKKRKEPTRYYTVEQMLSAAGLEIKDQCEEIQSKAKEIVSGVCRTGSRFTKNCICVQLYEDAVDLMPVAMEKGALFCVTRRPVSGVPCVVTDDPSRVYADMCQLYHRDDILVTAVIGSIGKTTTKKMVQAVYARQENTLCDAGNDNQLDCAGYIGQHIPPKTKLWVQEVSEDTKGCVAYISKIIKPNIAIITAIDKSHIEEFGNAEGILNEIASITQYMQEDGICITSIDEANTASLIQDRKTITVSMKSRDADFYAIDVKVDNYGLAFKMVERETQKAYPIRLANVYARHNVYSALYAFAAGVLSGISYENIISGLQAYKSTGIRQNVYKARGVTVYADCYNAVAKSVRSAISTASEIPIQGKRIGVLGDIAETGEYTKEIHDEIISIVNESKFDVLIAYGPNICKAASHAKLRQSLKVLTCDSRAELNKTVKQMIKSGDLVLFKASRSSGLERTLKATFPATYIRKLWEYAYPLIKWRFVMLFN